MVDPVTGAPISERDISRREEVLARREREIEALEERVRNGTYTPPSTRNNFPPILKWWAYHPDEDLNENIRPLMKYYFWGYSLQFVVYLVNFVACITMLGAGADHVNTSVGLLIGIGGFLLFVWIPLGYELHYFLMYGAVSAGKGMKTVCSLVTYCIWWILLVINIIGPQEWGAVGFIIIAKLYSEQDGKKATLQGTIGLIFAILALADAAWLAFVFVKLCIFFKREGLTQKAFAEAGHYAAEQAYSNRETLVDAARDHPEIAQQAIGAAYG